MPRKRRPEQVVRWLGDAAVSSNGTMTLPKEARDHLGLTTAGSVLVFAAMGCVTITAVPSADDLLQLAADAADEMADN
jgi:bifunctional DNA-binding transcriptional regulator/antitoxin component of YhaV-PrlF toxin-antitoxin module